MFLTSGPLKISLLGQILKYLFSIVMPNIRLAYILLGQLENIYTSFRTWSHQFGGTM